MAQSTINKPMNKNVSDIETKLSAMVGTYHVNWGTSVSFPIKPGQHALVIESNSFYTIWRSGGGMDSNYYLNNTGGTSKVSDAKNIVLNGDICTVSNKSGSYSTYNVIVIG